MVTPPGEQDPEDCTCSRMVHDQIELRTPSGLSITMTGPTTEYSSSGLVARDPRIELSTQFSHASIRLEGDGIYLNASNIYIHASSQMSVSSAGTTTVGGSDGVTVGSPSDVVIRGRLVKLNPP
jgi:hypothetical protein